MMTRQWRCCLTLLCILQLAQAARAQGRRELAFPDVPGYITLKCDFHMHTVFSDGEVWPTVRVDEAWRQGLDAISITDHIEYQPHKANVPTNHNRPYELALEPARQKNILLIRGAEITRETPPGHFNAVFLEDVKPLDTPEFFDVFDAAAAQGAFVFWNHPGWQGEEKGRWGPPQQTLLDKQQLRGIEFCNGQSFYADACREAYERNLTLIGNSDEHSPFSDQPWTPEKHRTLTLVFAKDRSLAGVKDALIARRTAVWFQNRLFGREAQLRPLFEACIKVRPAHYRSGDTVWTEIENCCELDIELECLPPHQQRIGLPSRVTTLVRFRVADEQKSTESVNCRVLNFMAGPTDALSAKIEIPLTGRPAAVLEAAPR